MRQAAFAETSPVVPRQRGGLRRGAIGPTHAERRGQGRPRGLIYRSGQTTRCLWGPRGAPTRIKSDNRLEDAVDSAAQGYLTPATF
ncbi:hypothetical protein MTO96_016156 [Rhipicephalus appendiculatus]